jgi:hypothetical protein
MNVNLVTDAPKHNLVLMKLSGAYKEKGYRVWLNGVGEFDDTIGSWLFSRSEKVPCTKEGGPGVNNYVYDPYDKLRPDYGLYGLDYSLGYTWRYCPRKCSFCVVPKLVEIPRLHHSIWNFHDSRFTKICLLNNNTFSDPQWKETFEEIWEADLTVIDENGYDLRLIDEEKADALRKTKFQGQIHYAWDNIADEKKILDGLKIAPRGMVYVLVGYNTTQDEDFHRCQKIHDLGHDPYVMPYNRGNKELRAFKRFIDSRMYRKYPTLREAWGAYG